MIDIEYSMNVKIKSEDFIGGRRENKNLNIYSLHFVHRNYFLSITIV